MSRLQDRIEEQRKIVAEKQDDLDIAKSVLEALEYRARKYKSKSIRKAHRKKLVNDPVYAMIHKIQKEMWKPQPVFTEHSRSINLPLFNGMEDQLKLEKSKEDNSFFARYVRDLFYGRFRK